jgi:hypothetical protein
MEKGTKGKQIGSNRAYIARFCWPRRAAAGRVLMDKGWMMEVSDAPGQGYEDVPPSLNPAAGPEVRASAPLASPGRRHRAGGGDARPVHNTAQYPFPDAMAQSGVYSKGRTPHPMVNIGRVERRTTATLPGRGVGGQHADTKAMRTSPLSSSRA